MMLFEYNVVGRGGGADGHANAIIVGPTSDSSCGVCGAYSMGLVRYMLLFVDVVTVILLAARFCWMLFLCEVGR